MNYKGSHLAGFVFVAGILTAGMLWGLSAFPDWPWLQAFFFDRSPVQWATLGVFTFILCVLVHRLVIHGQVQVSLRHLSDPSGKTGSSVAPLLVDRWRRVKTCLAKGGLRSAAQCNQDLADEDEASLNRIYGLLGHAMQFMLALGFFGTVWGISQSMAGSFGNLSGGNPETMKQGLESFTSSLGVALDTTLLAIIGSLIASVLSTAINWLETNRIESVKKAISTELSLDLGGTAPDGVDVQEIRTELEMLVKPVLEQGQSAFESMVLQACQSFEENLTSAIQKHLSALREHENGWGNQLTEALETQTARSIQVTVEQNSLLRDEIGRAFSGLSRKLGQAPEISIKYPGLNGSEPKSSVIQEVSV